MSYKPKHCCQCGEKIDRENWKPWTSRRFCELCETEFGIYDKLRAGLVGTALLFGLYGIGSYFQKPEKQMSLVPRQVAASTANTGTNQPKSVAQVSTETTVQTPKQSNRSDAPTIAQTAPAATNLKIKPPEKLVETTERAYFCGAPTKKGTLCSRRVKNGGRCWQHEGQAALLPQEKLIAAPSN